MGGHFAGTAFARLFLQRDAKSGRAPAQQNCIATGPGGLVTRRGNSRPATPAPSDHLGAGGELKRCCDHVASAAPRCISTRPRPIRPPRLPPLMRQEAPASVPSALPVCSPGLGHAWPASVGLTGLGCRRGTKSRVPHGCSRSMVLSQIFKKQELAVWSSGMILASGARGPGFNSRNSPF